jgi:hypothetical protein
MPPLALTLNLTAIHALAGLREDPALVPRFPVGARLPRADHDPLVEAVDGNAQLDTHKACLLFCGIDTLPHSGVPVGLLSFGDLYVSDDRHHGATSKSVRCKMQTILALCRCGAGSTLERWSQPHRQRWSWVALDDVVAAYRFVLESELAGPVNLMSPNPVTNLQFVMALGGALHRPAVFPLPAVAVKTAFGDMGETVLLESQRGLPARLLGAGFAFTYPELGAALHRTLAG